MGATAISLDYEGRSRAQLAGPKSVGIWNYMHDPSTQLTMCAWRWNHGGLIHQADFTDGDTLPPDVIDALTDPNVEKWAFNAAFERLATKTILKVDTPIKGWRCTMALSYMRSFTGGLGDVGSQIGLPADMQKDKRGKQLINLFAMPQRITKANPHEWRTRLTDPDQWQEFLDYNRGDVVAEDAIHERMIKYGVLEKEWELYEADQEINDAGLPVDMPFVRSAMVLSARRKEELTEQLAEVTSLKNPNSTQQLLPWLQERGYPFADLQKLTIKKVLVENKSGENPGFLDDEAVNVLRMRQQVSRTSVKKYDAINLRVTPDSRLRHCFQFAGAARTSRWAGRGPQPQNLVRTPKEFEARDGAFVIADMVTDAIRERRYEELQLLIDEPLYALSGAIRSSFRAPEGMEFVVADLSAIESAVIAWLSDCSRLLRVFNQGLDPYKDFGTVLYNLAYDLITKEQRTICKPPTLGCGFGLGGGGMRNGKKTGLWAYAEGMGVNISQAEAARQVKLWRDTYKEIPLLWRKIEQACKIAFNGGAAKVNGLLRFSRTSDREFMCMTLPSGRDVFYHKPVVAEHQFESTKNPGEFYTAERFTCAGMIQGTRKWSRIFSGGPKVTENAVQATAREVLGVGILNARRDGFQIVGTVHDEIIALRRKGDNYFTLERLIEHMTAKQDWMTGLPLKAAGYVGEVYRKD